MRAQDQSPPEGGDAVFDASPIGRRRRGRTDHSAAATAAQTLADRACRWASSVNPWTDSRTELRFSSSAFRCTAAVVNRSCLWREQGFT